MIYPKNVDEILQQTDLPAVGLDEGGLFNYVNHAFEQTYGWTKEELLGKSVTTIMPPNFRDAHHIGFSRFLITEKATIAGKPLPLAVLFKDGRIHDAEHFILTDKKDGKWRFAATISVR